LAGIKTAVIGCGARSEGHLTASDKSVGLDIVYVCDKDATRAESTAKAHGVGFADDYHKVLADDKTEAVIIVTDVGSHVRIAQDAIRAGKHVIVEKPLGDNINEAQKLVAAVEVSPIVCAVSFQSRFMGYMARLKEAASSIDPVQIFFGRQRGMMKPQFLNPSPFCGIMDVCAHDFDLVAWFMGRQPLATTAILRRNTFTPDTGAADIISALLDFGDGRTATVVSSIGANEIGLKCDIVGVRGNATLTSAKELTGVQFAEYESDGAKKTIPFNPPEKTNPDTEFQKAFARKIRGQGTSQAATVKDGLNSLLVTLACLKSSEENRRVELAELL